jgi:hypothetical protein
LKHRQDLAVQAVGARADFQQVAEGRVGEVRRMGVIDRRLGAVRADPGCAVVEDDGEAAVLGAERIEFFPRFAQYFAGHNQRVLVVDRHAGGKPARAEAVIPRT